MSIEVRPLEWRNVDASPQSDDWWFEASTPFGNYTVTFIEEHTLPWLLEPFRSNLASNYATEDEAMSAGAADDMSRHYTNVPQAPLIDAINKLPVIDAWAKAEWLTDPLTWQFKLLRWENHGRRGAPKMEAAE